mmetsp:Transcript_15898/g.33785  ORF Transcript_15898/g.33785 Transcript_15898/m.33785 type:complete len:154 (+) Transcript_15898:719-1180(+)
MSQTLNCIADLSTAHRTTRAAGMSPLSKRALAIHCVPMLAHASEVLFFDDDVVVSPRMADIFEAVEPALIGAVFERHKPQGWHSMHWRTACAIYNVSSCKPKSSCASPPRALTNFLPYCPVLPIPIDLLEWLHRDRPRPEDTPVVSPPAKHMR